MDDGPQTPTYQQRIPDFPSRRYPGMPYTGSWGSNSLSGYPCHGVSPLDTSTNVSSCPLSGNVSSCMYASQRSAPYQPYLGRPGLTPEQWMDLSQDPTMRSRPCFTSHQTRELEREFSVCQYITRRRRIELAYTLNLTEKQIKTWFQNRRVKERKLKKPDSDS